MTLLKKIRNLVFMALAVYSLAVAAVEGLASSRHARHFLCDLTTSHPQFADIPLYGINTSFSVFFLWSGAVVFLLAWCCLRSEEHGGREEFFLVSQMIIFFYLGCDDRFLVHEGWSDAVGMKDWLFFGALGALEAYCLLVPGRLLLRGRKVLWDVFWAGFFFVLMMVADVLLPYDMRFRLSIEDLAKLWSAFFLFKFAWDTCTAKIEKLKGASV